MKFNIFKWWELWGKMIIYIFISILTIMLIIGYYFVEDKSGILSFVLSIFYALILFFIMTIINRINCSIEEKLNERKTFYLTLRQLRDVTNSTIKKADRNNLKDLKEHIITFQLFTGRESNMVEGRIKGENIPVYIKERGFTYTSEMLKLETKFLKLYEEGENKKKLLKNAKELCKYYDKSCKRLESTYNKIAHIYGGALFELIEKDNRVYDTEYLLNDIGSKIDEIISEINSIKRGI